MVTLDYCRELGVPIEVFTNTNADAYIYNESTGMTKPMRYRTAKADVYGYVSELLAKATDKGALDKELTATDQEKLVEFLKDFGELGDKLTYEGGERRGYTTVPAAAGTPAYSSVTSRPPPRSSPAGWAATSPSSSGSTRRC